MKGSKNNGRSSITATGGVPCARAPRRKVLLAVTVAPLSVALLLATGCGGGPSAPGGANQDQEVTGGETTEPLRSDFLQESTYPEDP